MIPVCLLCIFSLVACAVPQPATQSQSPTLTVAVQPTAILPPQPFSADGLGAGFRYSSYGPSRDPGSNYWAQVGVQMAERFPDAHPQAIWIVGVMQGEGTYLNFRAETNDPYISSGYVDMNESALTLFDQQGMRVWLQVEPGKADMKTLIDLVMKQYRHHPSVIGFGVDVEWYQSDGSAEGKPVTDAEAEQWLQAVRAYGTQYRLFLKHWDAEWMPPTVRDGLVFVDDSQQFTSLEQMVDEFAAWGQRFAPAPVAFQYGYPDDQHWWKRLNDPPGDIGKAILQAVPNTSALFWVDFTVIEVFPP